LLPLLKKEEKKLKIYLFELKIVISSEKQFKYYNLNMFNLNIFSIQGTINPTYLQGVKIHLIKYTSILEIIKFIK